MRFKNEPVWVRVDASGRPVLDSTGRAEMKYRENDTRTYRPQPVNLQAMEQAETVADAEPEDVPREAAGPDTVDIWTDGACSGNPGPMGIGMVILADGKRIERGEFLGVGTNNIAELTAIRRGLELAADLVRDRSRPTRLHSDSGYAIGLLSKNWKAKANQELVAELRRLVKAFPKLRFVKVAGHAGVELNERCDELARAAIARRGAV